MRFLGWIAALLLVVCGSSARGAENERTPLELTTRLGAEIDAGERERYGFLPSVQGFRSARLYSRGRDGATLEWSAFRDGKDRSDRVQLDARDLRLMRTQAEIVERAETGDASGTLSRAASLDYWIAHFASRGRHDIALALAEEAGSIGSPDENRVLGLRELAGKGSRVFSREGLLKKSGRTEFLIFTGYYGVWLGIATPLAGQVNDAQDFALGLLLGAPASILAGHAFASHHDMSRGRATAVAALGHLGTMQGLGWPITQDEDTHVVMKAGIAGGLAGIGLALLGTSYLDPTEGHAEIAHSGLPWGTWLGVVGAALASDEESSTNDDRLGRGALIGADVGVLAGSILGYGSTMSRTRVRLINLSGVVGAMMGLGIDLLTEVDDQDAVLGSVAAASILGAAGGVWITKHLDDHRAESGDALLSPEPNLGLRTTSTGATEWSASLSVRLP